MNLNEYQEFTNTTAIYPKEVDDFSLAYLGLGLTGEAGEVANKIKKIYRDKNGKIDEADSVNIAAELGDCLWYIAQISERIGISMQAVLEANHIKLSGRLEQNTIKGSGDSR